jgi:hypothetical protein
MKNSIPKTVGEFRRDMAALGSTFFIVYTEVERASGRHKIMISSNSTPVGIGAILGPMLQPTEAALSMMVEALPKPGWFSSKKKREAQARALLADLLKMLTVPDILADQPPPESKLKLIIQ